MRKRICIVGGGISGLVCAHTLKMSAARSGLHLKITVLERMHRLGGQIHTQNLLANGSRAIVESGAEGFVARSELFPALAVSSGVGESQIVSQSRIADYELQRRNGDWAIEPLLPGEAAQKLGFQVPAKDRGRGIRSFRCGMGQLVSRLGETIPDVHFGCRVDKVSLTEFNDALAIEFVENGRIAEIKADHVVLSVPWDELKRIVSTPTGDIIHPTINHSSHVSIHVLTRKMSGVNPRSFTVPEDLQAQFSGLRAVSFMEDKFRGRCDDDKWLFRFYFRPAESSLVESEDLWLSVARDTLRCVLGIDAVIWAHYSPWKDTLPVFKPDHADTRAKTLEDIRVIFGDKINLIGSEVWGAGLEVAAQSGRNAANEILSNLAG